MISIQNVDFIDIGITTKTFFLINNENFMNEGPQ